jgi:hypothetical protein
MIYANSTDNVANPVYPGLNASVAKWRRLAMGRKLTDGETELYGRAVLDAIGALNRSRLAREIPTHKSPCASGSWASDGKAILKAVRAQNLARLNYAPPPDLERNARLYKEAMADKRARELQDAA